MITIGIYDEHQLSQEGIRSLLTGVHDIDVILSTGSREILFEKLTASPVHILLFNIHSLTDQIINTITRVNTGFPKTGILAISGHNDEKVILKTIKAGARGFLAHDTDRNELIEAIYMLRNGHDFYSRSITHLLLNRYISNIQSGDNSGNYSVRNLSVREIEILKLWGSSHSNREIADKLFISMRTVESHKNHIMQKLNLKTAVDLVKFGIRNNIIDI